MCPTPRKPVWLLEDLNLYLDVVAGLRPPVNWLDRASYRQQAPEEVGQGW